MIARNDADCPESLAAANATRAASHRPTGDGIGLRRAPHRSALFGPFGCGKLGNEVLLEAMVGFLRGGRPEAELSRACRNPEVVKEVFGPETLPIRWNGLASALSPRVNRLLLKIPVKPAVP